MREQLDTVRIGCGAGFQGDRLEPALILAAQAKLDYLMLECLGERTVALAQLRKLHDPAGGYDPLLERRMTGLLPLIRQNHVRVVTNMGAANPIAGAEKIVALARKLGVKLRVAALTGDDVLEALDPAQKVLETGEPLVERRAAVLRQCLSRRRGDAAGARKRRRCRAHRPRRRSVAGARTARASFRLETRRHGALRARHRGRASARMRRTAHRRLLRGSGQEGRARHGAARLSVRRRGRGRQCAVLQGRRHRRHHQPHDRDRAAALRGDRSARLSDAGRHGGLSPRSKSPRPRRTRSRSPARAAAGGPTRSR